MQFKPAIFLVLFFLIITAGCTNSSTGQSDTEAGLQESTVGYEYFPPEDPTAGLEDGDAQLGLEYFMGSNRGRCLDCHTVGGEGNDRGFDGEVWALDDTGLRRDPDWLAVYLDNPRNLRPEIARMPPFRGDEAGATLADVVAYLMTLRTEIDHPESTDVKPEDEPDPNFEGIGGFTGTHDG